MEFQYKGANCITISTKAGALITDPNLVQLGLKKPSFNKIDVCLLTDPAFKPEDIGEAFLIDCPGEYEVKGYAVKGINARSHMAKEDEIDLTTIYRISSNEISVVFLGHIFPQLDDLQLEALGMVDVLVVPVGGNGYTLDATGAAKLAKLIDPKIIIATHFADPQLNYEVPQNGPEDFIKEIGAPHEELEKLKLKKETLPETLAVYTLKRS